MSTEVHLSLIYLIKFPMGVTPERQDITVSYVSSSRPKSVRLSLATFAERPSELMARGYIGYRVKYTARTWGADIEALLGNHIDHLMMQEGCVRGFVRKNSVWIGLFVGALSFLIVFYGQPVITERLVDGQISSISNLLGPSGNLAGKLHAIIRMLITGSAAKLGEVSSRFVMVGFFFSVFLTIFVENKADSRMPSFVVLTKRSGDEKASILKKYNRDWLKFWGSVFLSVVVGVTANIAYDFYAKKTVSEFLEKIPAVNSNESSK